jgi:hypothetical protein
MRWLFGLVVVGLACPSSSLLAQSGKLGAVRDEVREDDTPPPKSDKEDRSDKSDNVDCSPWTGPELSGSTCASCGDSDYGNSFLGHLFGAALAAPFLIPKFETERDGYGYFPDFPYDAHLPGYMIPVKEEANAGGLRTWAGRFSVEYGTDFDGLEKVGGRVLLETTSRFGIQARLNCFREKLWCGCFDELTLGSTELTFRFAQSPHIQMYAGLGVRWLDDRFDTEWGVNFTYGADLFPVKPLVVSLSLDAGTLGDAGVFEARGTVGAIFHRFEVFTGYEHRWIGSADLGSFLAGLRVWF